MGADQACVCGQSGHFLPLRCSRQKQLLQHSKNTSTLKTRPESRCPESLLYDGLFLSIHFSGWQSHQQNEHHPPSRLRKLSKNASFHLTSSSTSFHASEVPFTAVLPHFVPVSSLAKFWCHNRFYDPSLSVDQEVQSCLRSEDRLLI